METQPSICDIPRSKKALNTLTDLQFLDDEKYKRKPKNKKIVKYKKDLKILIIAVV
jgi:hypothetical protein